VGFYELASSLALFSVITAIEQGSLCARNLFSREQFQLRASKQSSAALFCSSFWKTRFSSRLDG
jgi:hypothetical protein